jgi:hypothetical protein
MFGGWRGIMSKKRPYTGIDWSGYVPQMNTPMADPGLVAANERVRTGTTIPQTKKKGSMIKDIADALKDLKPGPDATPLTGQEFGRGMPAQLGFSLANMGAYVGDPVARQAAMAKARMEEELQRRRKLLGGGY